ncbi:PIN domain-containing protein [Streptomyces coeruleorubidus]|uniref:PIN domain-containing protein n=1 Tax=Streptomyces coeruleorubidus TaxID=116188 RepID=UPI003826CDCE
MERLILDTGVLIAVERRKVVLDHVLADDDDPVIATITAAELLQGVELADDTDRLARQSFVDAILATVPVEEYTVDIARAHARLLAHVRRAGRPRGAHGLIIAATALTTARTVVTYDKRARFDDLPGVRVRRL